MTEENDVLLSTREARVRYIRESLGLSRMQMEERYKIPRSTMQGWESKKHGGLPELSAKKLIEIFKAEGLTHITLEWLMYGIGENPFASSLQIQEPEARYEIAEQKRIEQELKTFHVLNENSVDLRIPDDRMVPYVGKGDYVAGQWLADEEMESAIGFCIAQTPTGERLARFVETGREKGQYTLRCAHPDSEIIRDVALQAIAPILWIRKLKSLK